MPLKSYYKSSDGAFTLLLGDCRQLLSQFDFQFDMIFADPPYFLSNGGISVQSGKIVCVDKGDWDRSFIKNPLIILIINGLLIVVTNLKIMVQFGYQGLIIIFFCS